MDLIALSDLSSQLELDRTFCGRDGGRAGMGGVALLDRPPAHVVAPPPPDGNTGGKLTAGEIRTKIDWFNATFPLTNLDEVRTVIETFLGPAADRDRGAAGYAQGVGWESGAILCWTEGRAECWLSLNGDSLDLIASSVKLGVLRQLASFGGKCTRVDIALDLARDLISMEDVHAAAVSGQVQGFRLYDAQRPRNMSTGELLGDTAKFGRRGKNGGGCYYRIYDKGLESDGELDCIRVEPEFSGDKAHLVFLSICSQPDLPALSKFLAETAAGCITFADKSGAHGHESRFKVLGWWESIRKLTGFARVVVDRVKPALEASAAFIRRATPRNLARVAGVIDQRGGDGEAFVVDWAR